MGAIKRVRVTRNDCSDIRHYGLLEDIETFEKETGMTVGMVDYRLIRSLWQTETEIDSRRPPGRSRQRMTRLGHPSSESGSRRGVNKKRPANLHPGA